MAVPEAIRKVERPKNTVVVAYGKNKDKYAVKARIGCRSVNGRKLPVDGPTIGHIIDGRYVEVTDVPAMRESECDFRRWADVQLCCNLSQDILEDLRKVYNEGDAMKTYVSAVLRTVEPDITDGDLADTYSDTWLSKRYPGVALSANTISDHISQLGRTCSKITDFMILRTARVGADHHVAVDGTLKSDESRVNTFSDYSRKALKKGTRDISVIYAYDVETCEPVCSRSFSGNTVDVATMGEFIESNHLDRGMIIADKGFSYTAAKQAMDSRKDLHFLLPLKRDSGCIKRYLMYEYNSNVPGFKGLKCRKERIDGGRFLYSFQDAQRASEEESAWVDSHDSYSPRELAELRKEFGSIVFLSDTDMEPCTAYKAYDERWSIEVMFRFYKDILEFDKTRVHDDWSVVGTEFINFLSIVMTCKLRKAFDKVPLLDGVSYNRTMRLLRKAAMVRDSNGEWLMRKATERERAVLTDLGLIPRITEIRNPVGRPKGRKSSKSSA